MGVQFNDSERCELHDLTARMRRDDHGLDARDGVAFPRLLRALAGRIAR